VTALLQASAEVSSEQATAVLDRAAQRKGRLLCGVAAAIGLAAVALFSRAVGTATFVLSPRGEDVLDVAVPAGSTALVLGGAACALAATGAVRLSPARAPAVLATAMALFVAAMLTWATAEGTTNLVGLFNGTMQRATPLVLGALAGVLCERAGVVNIAIEGMLLAGAFAGALIGSAADNFVVGLAGGMAVGLLFAAMLGVLSIRFKVDQVVGGAVLNILSLGLTSYLGARVLTEYANLNNPPSFRRIEVPVLQEIPFLGPILFENSVHVFAAFAVVAALAFTLSSTRWGLRLRAVGEHPSAADTVGVNVERTRYRAVLLGGAVAGFGGTFFTLQGGTPFQENMTNGRGFIALAALIVGRWHPVGAFGAALLFGFAEEFQGRLASLGSPIPSEFLRMAPYLVTLVVVAGLIGRARPPAADGQPFER
jgi:simple sugar transport system permease protein